MAAETAGAREDDGRIGEEQREQKRPDERPDQREDHLPRRDRPTAKLAC
jgi:hypothetical protein